MSAQAPTTAELLARYDRPGPRYTSYPTAIEFHAGFGEREYIERLEAADALGNEPLSMYAHLPFCEERCLFCGCNVVVTKHRDVTEKYLEHVLAEVDLLAKRLPNRRKVSQMHWGGGTPTFYPAHELEKLFRAIGERFEFTPDAELGIEVDPRVTTPRQIETLRRLGFNRLSMGVQDFAPEVQRAVHRIQSFEWTRGMVEQARAEGFTSVNIDLIYGLPYQTTEGFRQTLERVVEIRPDRVAVYSFAFVPWIKAHMKHLPQESMPDAALKLELLALSIDAFTRAGYRAIGMDHFALPEDELSRAIESRTLSRNFMGYTVQSARDMVGLGISAIGDVQGAFVQNVKKLPTYEESIAAGRFPVERGYRLDADDTLRRHVITELMCNFHLDAQDVSRRFGVSFEEYFATELDELRGAPSVDQLIQVTPETLEVTPLGRMFIRNLCMIFDRHLRTRAAGEKPVFSRTV